MKSIRQTTYKQGFTIIELMMATAVFAVILVLITSGILQIGRSYEKGVNQSRTLNTARAITDEVTESIKFARGDISSELTNGSSRGYCIGNKLYSYIRGQQVDATRHAVIASDVQNCSLPLSPLSPSGTDRELLGDKMRLANLNVQETAPGSGVYKVVVRVVYGDDDLICSPTKNNCGDAATMSAVDLGTLTDLRCKNLRAGNQYCALSELNTTVERRL